MTGTTVVRNIPFVPFIPFVPIVPKFPYYSLLITNFSLLIKAKKGLPLGKPFGV